MVTKKAVGRSILTWVGPLALAAFTYVREHPEIWEKLREQGVWDSIKKQIDRLSRRQGSTPEDLLTTVSILRDQVSYLEKSADDEGEARRARAWATQLNSCERAAALLKAPDTRRGEMKSVKKKVAALRSEILGAYITEQGEDARDDSAPTV